MDNILSALQFDNPFKSIHKKWFDRTLLYLRAGNKAQLEYSELLYSLVSSIKPKNILEIGTARGFGTAIMAKAAFDSKIENCKIVSFDIRNPKSKINWHAEKHNDNDPFKDRVLSLEDIWNEYDPSKSLMEKISFTNQSLLNSISKLNNKIDFVFIDGDHTYSGVKNDFESIESYLNPNAVVLFDDYYHGNSYEIFKFLKQRSLKIKINFGLYGLKKYVDEVVRRGDYVSWKPSTSNFKRVNLLIKKKK